MNIYAWIGVLGVIILTLASFIYKKNRTKENVKATMLIVLIMLGVIVSVEWLKAPYLLMVTIGVILIYLVQKKFKVNEDVEKTKHFTKRRLLLTGGIIVLVIIVAMFLFRDNPDYVVKHLQKHPDSTSFYAMENGEEIIAYEADVVRPLASMVKILIAIEYAMQIESGEIDEERLVSLDELESYYIKNTDGNAHPSWLEEMEVTDKIGEAQVTLRDVAYGMIRYSSNANTDYLIDLLGVDRIDERAQEMGLTEHEAVYPIVGALLIPNYMENKPKKGKELIAALESMSPEAYREAAIDISQRLKIGDIKAENIAYDKSLHVQKVWSDRLTGATAREYVRLLHTISHNELPKVANEKLRDLLEWPLEVNEGNKENYVHLGSKGGSTGFILNDGMYAEGHEGDKVELVILTDDLNQWQSIMLEHNFNSFEAWFLGSESYRKQVAEELNDN